MIVLVSGQGDVHARYVATLLHKLGQPVVIIDSAELAAGRKIAFDPMRKYGFIETASAGRIKADDIRSVWYRRPGAPVIHPDIVDPFDHRFAEAEWQHTIDGFFGTLGRRVVNDVFAQRAAIKPRQLAAAQAAGLRIPATLVTNDADEALAFVAEHGAVVHKAMVAPPHRFIDTRLWSDEDRAHLRDLVLCPTVFQEYVAGPCDLRLTVVGREIFAARIESGIGRSPVDSRLDLEVPCLRHELRDDVAAAVLRLMDALGLEFGTIDMKLTDGGEHVFFEINPQGQFLYIEILTGMPITAAVAARLAAG